MIARLSTSVILSGVMWWTVVLSASAQPVEGDEPEPESATESATEDATEGATDYSDPSEVIIENIGDIRDARGDEDNDGNGDATGAGDSENSDQSDGAPATAVEMPWSKGVPMEQRRRARDLFEVGNKRARDNYYATAEARYNEAIALWPHPAFYYNRALVQIRLGKHLDAHESFQEALRYEDAPIKAEKREEARRHLMGIEHEMTRVVITCDVPGAKVTLNGSVLFMGPGRYENIEEPGLYRIVAEKPGHLTDSHDLLFMAGARVQLDMTLRYESYERRWARWKPWAVTVGGAALLGASAYATWRAANRFADLERDCGVMGCETSKIEATENEAIQWRSRALLGYLAGSAVLATGAVLLYMNREQRVERVVEGNSSRISVIPVLTPDSAGVRAGWKF